MYLPLLPGKKFQCRPTKMSKKWTNMSLKEKSAVSVFPQKTSNHTGISHIFTPELLSVSRRDPGNLWFLGVYRHLFPHLASENRPEPRYTSTEAEWQRPINNFLNPTTESKPLPLSHSSHTSSFVMLVAHSGTKRSPCFTSNAVASLRCQNECLCVFLPGINNVKLTCCNNSIIKIFGAWRNWWQ